MTSAAQLKATREYKARRRLYDPEFVESEKLSRRLYAERLYTFSKRARAFAKAYPDLFKAFTEANG